MLSMNLKGTTGLAGPRESLVRQGYTTEYVPLEFDTYPRGSTVSMSDFYVDMITHRIYIKAEAAFRLTLESVVNPQFFAEAVYHFVAYDNYGKLLEHLKEYGAYEKFAEHCIDIFGTTFAEEISGMMC